MARPNYYVISHDAGYSLPYGFAWLDDMGTHSAAFASVFTYCATRAECVALSKTHPTRTNPVLLDDDTSGLDIAA